VTDVLSRLHEILGSLPTDGDPTVFAVRSHAAAAALYSEGLATQLRSDWNPDPFFVATDSIEAARTSAASLVLARYRVGHARSATLVEADRHTTLLNLGPGSLDVLVYRTVDAERGDPHLGRQLLSPVFRTLAPGEVVAALAGQEIIDIIPTGETVVAWILSRPTRRGRWEYDRQTGASIGCRKGALEIP
jgi:hypothetical protein